jgi:hypothetical protein
MTAGYVYFVQSAGTSVKIGWSSDPVRRLKALATANATPLRLLGTFPGSKRIERFLHRKCAHLRASQGRLGREWFLACRELREIVHEWIPGEPLGAMRIPGQLEPRPFDRRRRLASQMPEVRLTVRAQLSDETLASVTRLSPARKRPRK